MMGKVKEFLFKIFYIVFMLAPCALAAYFSINYLIDCHVDRYVFNISVFLTVIVALVFLFFSMRFEINIRKERFIVCILVLSAFLYRLLIVDYVDAAPVSDFLMAYENAKLWAKKGYFFIEHYRQYPYWGMWVYVISVVFRVTGNISVRTAQMINVCLDSVTVSIVYGIVRLGLSEYITKIPYKKIAFLSAAIYSFAPGIALYTGALTNEFSAVFFAALTVLLLVFAHTANRAQKSKIRIYLFYLGSGISLGIMNWFKPIAGIILIAWIIAILLCEVCPLLCEKKLDKNRLAHYLAIIVLVTATEFVVNQAGLVYFSNIMGISKQELNSGQIWAQLYAGLNIEDNGKLGTTLRALKEELEAQYQGNDLTEEWKRRTIENIKANYKKFPSLFLTKFREGWTGERAFIAHGTRRSPDLDEERKKYYDDVMNYNKRPLYNSLTLCYILLLVLCVFGAIYLFRRNNIALFICALFIFGYMLIELVIEVQNRYKSLIYWALAIVAGLGGYQFYLILRYIFELLAKGANLAGWLGKSSSVKKSNAQYREIHNNGEIRSENSCQNT